MRKLLIKIRQNGGSVSIEAAAAAMIFLPILLSLILGAFFFYKTTIRSNDLNFNAGRYASTTGCSIEKLSAMAVNENFADYTVVVYEGSNEATISLGAKGRVYIRCQADSDKGSEFEVTTMVSTSVETPVHLFPITITRRENYVQEAFE